MSNDVLLLGEEGGTELHAILVQELFVGGMGFACGRRCYRC